MSTPIRLALVSLSLGACADKPTAADAVDPRCSTLAQSLCRRNAASCQVVEQELSAIRPSPGDACEAGSTTLAALDVVAVEQQATVWRIGLEDVAAKSMEVARILATHAEHRLRWMSPTKASIEGLARADWALPSYGEADAVVRLTSRRVILEGDPPLDVDAASPTPGSAEHPLTRELRARAIRGRELAEARSELFNGAVLIFAEREVSLAGLMSVVDAGEAAGLPEYRLAVARGDGYGEIVFVRAPETPAPGGVVLRIDGPGFVLEPDRKIADVAALRRELGALAAADPERWTAVLQAPGATPMQRVVDTMRELQGHACDLKELLLADPKPPTCWFWQVLLAQSPDRQ
jgi:hypothetical protein